MPPSTAALCVRAGKYTGKNLVANSPTSRIQKDFPPGNQLTMCVCLVLAASSRSPYKMNGNNSASFEDGEGDGDGAARCAITGAAGDAAAPPAETEEALPGCCCRCCCALFNSCKYCNNIVLLSRSLLAEERSIVCDSKCVCGFVMGIFAKLVAW